MEELLNRVVQKTGLPMDQAKTAVAAVLGFIRGKLPADAAGKFQEAVTGLGQREQLPGNIPDMSALAEKTGLGTSQVGSLLETVMSFLKDKLPADVVSSVTAAVTKGGLAGVAQKVAGVFGRG